MHQAAGTAMREAAAARAAELPGAGQLFGNQAGRDPVDDGFPEKKLAPQAPAVRTVPQPPPQDPRDRGPPLPAACVRGPR